MTKAEKNGGIKNIVWMISERGICAIYKKELIFL